jgi:hypothetical protein
VSGVELAPTAASILGTLLTASIGLLGWMVRKLVTGQWVPESVHLRELRREQALAAGWRDAYFTLLAAHDLALKAVDTQGHGLQVTARVLESLPIPQPPEPPEGRADAAVVA